MASAGVVQNVADYHNLAKNLKKNCFAQDNSTTRILTKSGRAPSCIVLVCGGNV